MIDRWRGRFDTVRAMAVLCRARLMVALVPFSRWREGLGGQIQPRLPASPDSLCEAQRFARQVERAAHRLPFSTQCLPRAMALSWLLREARLPHLLVFAVRPAELRKTADALHAWVEVNGTKVIGDLPGPWIEMLRLGALPQGTADKSGR